MGEILSKLKCSVAECERPNEARGWCKPHYDRWRNQNAPIVTLRPPPAPTFEERFWQKVNKTESCWLWTGAKKPKGYGVIGVGGKKSGLAHRVSWRLASGSDPGPLWVLHRCDNPSCVRPDHLFLGTAKTNTADMVAKGRGVRPKLTPEAVKEIRGAVEAGESSRSLAKRYGVSGTLIRKALSQGYIGDRAVTGNGYPVNDQRTEAPGATNQPVEPVHPSTFGKIK